MASKFSTPFMAKSPLYGAYESGAGGKVHVSNRQAFQKLFDDAESVGSVKKEKEKEKDNTSSGMYMLGECPKGKVRSKINKKCVSKKGAGKEYDK
jgi:hypothetical protein